LLIRTEFQRANGGDENWGHLGAEIDDLIRVDGRVTRFRPLYLTKELAQLGTQSQREQAENRWRLVEGDISR
jgi:hypothetical protein